MTTDQAFESGGVRIAYDDVGEGAPVVLVHGFASNRRTNWRGTGWYDALTDAGRRVIALDCRGHGESGKPHEPDAYGTETMAADVIGLLDHLSIPEADLMGYSMGARISLSLLLSHPGRFNAVVLAGMGDSILGEPRDGSGMAEAFEAAEADSITDPRARQFREFAERRGNDLDALAALQRAPRSGTAPEDLTGVSRPVLVVTGEDDEIVGDPHALADAIPGAEAAIVPDRDHLTTVGDPAYTEAVLEFLKREGL